MVSTNKSVHKKMIEGICRAQNAYFDTNSSGDFINKFSNDVGIMDTMLTVTMLDAFDNCFLLITLLLNVFQINVYFIAAGILNVIFAVAYFIYCKPPIIAALQLYLKRKSPIFKELNEMVLGLTQIELLGQKLNTLKKFTLTVNESLKTVYSYGIVSRTFGLHVSLFSNIVLLIGLTVGVAIIDSADSGLYAISVVFLIQINDQV